MKKRYLQGILGVAVALGSMIPTVALLAEDGSSEDQKLQGTWMVTVTRVDPPPGTPPTFLSLNTFMPTGQVLEESNTTGLRSLGHGEWVRTGPRQFHITRVIFRFAAPPEPPRTFIGFGKITSDIRLNRRGDTFRGVSTTEQFDVDGNLVTTLSGTETGRHCGSFTPLERCLGIDQ